MESFRYVDIYATKGIEYLIVVCFLLAVVVFWRYLWYPGEEVESARGVSGTGGMFRVPTGYFFHQGHSWIKMEKEDLALVGLDDFAQKFIGLVDSLSLPVIGSPLRQGEVGWSININSTKIDMLSPIDGEVVEINREVNDLPWILNQDPYGKGRLIKVRPARITSNLAHLFTGTLARCWADEMIERLRELMDEQIGPLYQDGGLPVVGIVRTLNGDDSHALITKFFLTGEKEGTGLHS